MTDARQAHYDTMQVCRSGHMITSSMHRNPEDRESHCSSCGAETICACDKCGQEIRGNKYVPDFRYGMDFGDSAIYASSVPKFCVHCGNQFPWTREKINALVELAAEEESVSEEDRESIRQNARLIVTDNPRLEVAALQIKKIMGKIGKKVAPPFTKIVTELATETAKKLMDL